MRIYPEGMGLTIEGAPDGATAAYVSGTDDRGAPVKRRANPIALRTTECAATRRLPLSLKWISCETLTVELVGDDGACARGPLHCDLNPAMRSLRDDIRESVGDPASWRHSEALSASAFYFDGSVIEGWAFDESDPLRTLTVGLWLNWTLVTAKPAERSRRDLRERTSDPRHGFRFHIPLSAYEESPVAHVMVMGYRNRIERGVRDLSYKSAAEEARGRIVKRVSHLLQLMG